LIKVSNVLQDIYHEAYNQLFSLNSKQDLDVGVLLVIYIFTFYMFGDR